MRTETAAMGEKSESDENGKSDSDNGDENKIRGNWSHKLDFLLSLIGYCVGFGNVWRFPYLCYRNGGGAFLVPYFLMLAAAGIPMYFLELIIGQYASLGPVGIWNMAPLFRGVGIAAVVLTGVINIYYNTLLTYVFFYFFASMTSVLPWTTCDNDWNTPACRVRDSQANLNSTFMNETDYGVLNNTLPTPVGGQLYQSVVNISMTENTTYLRPKTPTEEYFERYVLDLSPGIDTMGSFKWQLVLCNILSWAVVYLCLMKGIKSTGKVVYVTATFPYIVLTILLVRGVTLEGSLKGLEFYLWPEWSRLKDPTVWGQAAAQIFYSLGPAWGNLIAFASYNKFHNNCHRDSVLASIVACLTSCYAGMVIFSVIGFMAHELNMPISKVMSSGPGLAFIAYPEALARMPFAPFWSVLFFAMLVTTGLDSMFAQIEVVVVSLTDAFPKYLRKNKAVFSLIVILIYFLLGLPQMTQGGMYILTLLDSYIANFSVMSIAFLEVTVIIYVYGYSKLANDVEVMMGFRPNIYFRVCWFAITPGVTLAVIMFNAVMHSPAVYNDYLFPDWAQNIGWVFGFIAIFSIPIYGFYHTCMHFGSVTAFSKAIKMPWTGETLRALTQPAPDWGPMMPQHRYEAGIPLTEEEEAALEAEGILVKRDRVRTTISLKEIELEPLQKV